MKQALHICLGVLILLVTQSCNGTAKPVGEPAAEGAEVVIRTRYAGVSAVTVESDVVNPLEATVRKAYGVNTLNTSVVNDSAVIHIWFNPEVTAADAEMSVRNQVEAVKLKLPAEVVRSLAITSITHPKEEEKP